MQHQNKFFANHRTLWPDVVDRENAKLFDREAREHSFNVFGINIFAFFCHDHVFLAARELQMTRAVKTAEVAGQKPAINDGFRGEFRFIQIAGHYGFATNSNFANAVGSRIHEIVKKLQCLRLSESAADDNGAEFSAKRFVHLLEQEAAEARARPVFRQRFVQANKHIENLSFARRQRLETCLHSFLQVFQNEWNETHISDLVLRKSFPHVFRTKSAQMHDRRAARERPEKTDHEINGVVRRQNTEVTHPRPE